MAGPPSEFGGAYPRYPPSTVVHSLSHYPLQLQPPAVELQQMGTYVEPSPPLNFPGLAPYSPPLALSRMPQFSLSSAPVPPFPPPSLAQSPPSMRPGPVLPAPTTITGTYRLSHTFCGVPSQVTPTWLTHAQHPPVMPFPPPTPPPSLSHHDSTLISRPAVMQIPPGQTLYQPPPPQIQYRYLPGMHPLSHAVVSSQFAPQWLSPQATVFSQAPLQTEQWQHTFMPARSTIPTTPQVARPVPMYRHPPPRYGSLQGPSREPPHFGPEETPFSSQTLPTRLLYMMPPDPAMMPGPSAMPGDPSTMPGTSAISGPSTESPHITPQSKEPEMELPGTEEEVATNPPAEPSQEELKEFDDYKEFAVAFKNQRTKLEYTQADVSQQVGIRYGVTFSQPTIFQFESIQLEMKTVRKMKPVLEMWVRDTAKAAGTSEEEIKEIIVSPSTSIYPRRERKRRTSIDAYAREQLETEFQRKRKPSQIEMGRMAATLGVEKDFVRIWFCNRRQRQKKREHDGASSSIQSGEGEPMATTTVKIPSPSHDITLEVPVLSPRGVPVTSPPAVLYITGAGQSTLSKRK